MVSPVDPEYQYKSVGGLQAFTEKVLNHHINNITYFLEGDGDTVHFKKIARPTTYDHLISARALLNISMEAAEIKGFGFSNEDVRKLACCAYQALRSDKLKNQVSSYTLKNATRNLMGMSTHCEIPEVFEKLVLENKLHYKINRLGITPQDRTTAHLLINGEWIQFKDLQLDKTEEGFNVRKKESDEILFKTDSKYKLKGYFFCGIQGIVEGCETAKALNGLKGTHKVDGDANYYVIVGTAVASTFSPSFRGDHSYIGLIDDQGNKVLFGQYGILDNPKLKDVPTMCAHKKVGIEAPDRYSGLPYTSYHTLETKHPISKKQYESLKKQAELDILHGRDGSMMEDNCTGYVQKTLGDILKVKTVMTPTAWFIKWLFPKILPNFLAERLIRFGDRLPAFITIPLHYLNPVYPLQIVYGLGQTLTSFEWKKGWKNLGNFNYVLRAIFCPWNFYVNHPLVLREWQKGRTS